MNLLTGKIVSHCKVIQITINKEVINIVEAISKKYGIKSPRKFKDCKEGTILKDDDENDDNYASISVVDNEDE